jgi:hypothetical protein
MEKQPHQSADIPTICAGLDIPKRRIYDVTNVLEGVGFLVRIGRNAYKWRYACRHTHSFLVQVD